MEKYGPNAENDVYDWTRSPQGKAEIGGQGYNIVPVERQVVDEYYQMYTGMRPVSVIGGEMSTGRDSVQRDAADDGYQLGKALGTIIGISANEDFESLSVIGMFLAEIKGYRDLRSGQAFVGGFMRGFRDARGEQGAIDAPK